MAKPTAKKYTVKSRQKDGSIKVGKTYWRGVYHCDGNCVPALIHGYCRGHSDGLGKFIRKSDAINAAAARQAEAQSQGYQAAKERNIWLNEVATDWFNSGRDVTESTVEWSWGIYRSRIEYNLGILPVGKIKPDTVEKFMLGLRDDGLSRSTMRSTLIVLRQILEYAVHPKGLINENPASGIKVPKSETKPKMIQPFTEDELWLVADQIREENRFLILLCGYTGLRIAEAAGLRAGDITWSEANGYILRVERQYRNRRYSDPKWDSKREVPITPKLWVELEKHMADFPPSENPDNVVFVNTRGTHLYYRSFLDHFHSVLETLGFERRGTHSLRHTFVKLAKKKGVNPWLIKEMAGHKSIAVTMDVYGIDTDTEDLVKAAHLLSGVHHFNGSQNTLTNGFAGDFAASIAATHGFDTDGTPPGFGGISN